jgi:hypothetical protein
MSISSVVKSFVVTLSVFSFILVFSAKNSLAQEVCFDSETQSPFPCPTSTPSPTPTPIPCFNSDQVEVPCPTETPLPTPTPCQTFAPDSEFPEPCPTESPTPDPIPTPLVCSGDQHANANNTQCVSYDRPGGGSSSGGGSSTTSTGQVLGASTLAATGDGNSKFAILLMLLGSAITISSLYVFKKRLV